MYIKPENFSNTIAITFRDDNSILLFGKFDSKNKMGIEIENKHNGLVNSKEIGYDDVIKLILFLQSQIK